MNAYHQDIYDKGLEQFSNNANWSGGTLSMAVCKGAPVTYADAASADGAGGKRISSIRALPAGEVVLGNRAGGGREITVAAKAAGATASATTVAGDDLHYAIFDGARLLVALDEASNQALTSGNPFDFPALKFGWGA